jgi:hypothetical protein
MVCVRLRDAFKIRERKVASDDCAPSVSAEFDLSEAVRHEEPPVIV